MFEIQYHPASIRKGVRFYFLSRRQVRRWLAGAAAVVAMTVSGLVVSPRGMGSVWAWVLSQGGRLHQQREMAEMERWRLAMEALEQSVEDSRQLQNRLSLIFGSSILESYAGGAAVEPRTIEPLARSSAALARAGELLEDVNLLMEQSALLDSLVSRRQTLVRSVPSISPLPGGAFALSSPFGARTSPFTGEAGFHSGLDLAAAEGTPVVAPGDGIVSFAGWVTAAEDVRWWRMGNVVAVDHHGLYTTVFAHLAEILVNPGDEITRGQVIGTVGSTGWSTSPHLHYEVRVAAEEGQPGVALDPRIFILNHDWSDNDAVLVASRRAPPPPVDPLPNLKEVR